MLAAIHHECLRIIFFAEINLDFARAVDLKFFSITFLGQFFRENSFKFWNCRVVRRINFIFNYFDNELDFLLFNGKN